MAEAEMETESPFDFSNPIFHDETLAREALEAVRWPNGPVCPHCHERERIARIQGKSARPGLLFCVGCTSQFTVTVGTVLEKSKIPLSKWWAAAFMLSGGKKGVSAHEIHRTLKITYKTAWFLMHRLREAMRRGNLSPLGGGGSAVEADETFIGNRKGRNVRYGYEHKNKILSLVDRESGQARSIVMDKLTSNAVAPIVRANVSREARLMTDEARHYVKVGREFADHQVVKHSTKEYVRGDAHTNTIEGFFSIFKRGVHGVYQHVSEQHLHRYLAEFDFRYNHRAKLGVNDTQRTIAAMKGIEGKRLTYRRTGRQTAAEEIPPQA